MGQEIDATKKALRGEHISAVFGSLTEKERAELRRLLAAVSRGIRGLVHTNGRPASAE